MPYSPQRRCILNNGDVEDHFRFRLFFRFCKGNHPIRAVLVVKWLINRIDYLNGLLDSYCEKRYCNIRELDEAEAEEARKSYHSLFKARPSGRTDLYAPLNCEDAPSPEDKTSPSNKPDGIMTTKRDVTHFYLYHCECSTHNNRAGFYVFKYHDVLPGQQFTLFPAYTQLDLMAAFWISAEGNVRIFETGDRGSRPISLMNRTDYITNPFLGPFLNDLISVKPNNEFLSQLPVRNLPIKNKDRTAASNLKDLLTVTTGVECSKNVSKWDPLLSISYLNSIPKINENDVPRLYQYVSNHPNKDDLIWSMYWNLNNCWMDDPCKQYSRGILFYYYYDRLQLGTFATQEKNDETIREYLRLNFLLGQFPNLKIRSIQRLIDECATLRHLFKDQQFIGLPIRFHTVYNVLKTDSNYGYNPINTNGQLLRESHDLHLCLLDYAGDIDRGLCGFYTITDKKTMKRYVAELVLENKYYFLNELKGSYNQDAPQIVIEAVQRQLKEINSRVEGHK